MERCPLLSFCFVLVAGATIFFYFSRSSTGSASMLVQVGWKTCQQEHLLVVRKFKFTVRSLRCTALSQVHRTAATRDGFAAVSRGRWNSRACNPSNCGKYPQQTSETDVVVRYGKVSETLNTNLPLLACLYLLLLLLQSDASPRGNLRWGINRNKWRRCDDTSNLLIGYVPLSY